MFRDSLIDIITNFVVVSSDGIKRVAYTTNAKHLLSISEYVSCFTYVRTHVKALKVNVL